MTLRRFTTAVDAIERALHAFSDVRPLAARELSAYGRDFAAGWEIPQLIEGRDLKLRVLVPETAPYSPPRVAVTPACTPLSWPHLEEQGLLCLLPEGATHELDAPGELALDLLSDGATVTKAGLAGSNATEFEDEFLSYWAQWPKRTAVMFSGCRASGPSRWISAWYSTAGVFLGETDESLQAWLRHRFSEKPPKDYATQRIPLLWLPVAPHPDRYPGSVADLSSLIAEPDAALLREHLLDRRADHRSVVLGCSTRRGSALFGVRITEPHRTRKGGHSLSDGFRPNNVPNATLVTRYQGTPLVGADVRRVDGQWVHGRDSNLDLKELSGKSALIFGAGAVGSSVATLLVKAGVGRTTVVDPQSFASENASRHELGIDRVGANKAEALAEALQKRLPHLEIRGSGASCADFCKKHESDVQNADLVISATADWTTETWLNSWTMENRAGRATMFGWLEPFAAAGHAIVGWGKAPCLRCLLDASGKLRLSATAWPGKTTRDIPACGGEFQPYGAVELAHVNALIGGLALDVLQGRVLDPAHRVWVGRTDYLTRIGGYWSPAWIAERGDPVTGGAIQELLYQRDPQCAECSSA